MLSKLIGFFRPKGRIDYVARLSSGECITGFLEYEGRYIPEKAVILVSEQVNRLLRPGETVLNTNIQQTNIQKTNTH